MAFQDFDKIQERVNAERKRKFRKKLIIASVSVILVVAAIVGAAFAYITIEKNNNQQGKSSSSSKTSNKGSHKEKAPATPNQSQKHGQVEQIVKTLCNSTLYKQNCEKTLNDTVKNDKALAANPNKLLKSVIEAVDEDLERVLKNVSSFKFDSREDRDAIEQCKTLVGHAKDDLIESINKVNGTKDVKSFEKVKPDLNNWLSAVMSYQETCLDGFEDGKLKSDIKKSFNSSQVLTSNSLAMIKSFDAYLSSLLSKATTRHLLEEKSSVHDDDHVPSWISHEDRRVLKAVDVKELKPNATVAKDGSGNFTTINEALKAMPEKYQGRYTIYVKQGVYDEAVTVDKKKANVTMIGDGSQKTIVTGNKSYANNTRTFLTATFVAQGEGFVAHSMGFRNTAGPEGHQAVAIRVQSDRSIFLNCRFEGYQDTLYAHTHRQYYRSCVIIGTIDFIFGDAAAVFQNCNIFIRKGLKDQQNTVTAQGRVDPFQTTGFVIHNCKIAPHDDLKPVKADFKSYLGRPWKNYSRTVVMETTIEDVIDPAGWLRWQETEFAIKTLFYGEFKNKGPSSKTDSRVKWPGLKVLKKEEALNYTVGTFLQGDWINATKTPVQYGFYEA